MPYIDDQTNSQSTTNSQTDAGLSQLNPALPDEIVRRGKEAMARLRRRYRDWMAIAEALDVGRAEVMRAVHTNLPIGSRYEKAMAEWLVANGFKEIDKGTRCRLLECLQHRVEIEIWRSRLTDTEKFCFNHPDTVLRKWKKAATSTPDSNTETKPSPVAKLKASIASLEEENHRMRREIEHGGGDLWRPTDRADDIATVLVSQLSPTKAERVARAILNKLKSKSRPTEQPAAIGGAP